MTLLSTWSWPLACLALLICIVLIFGIAWWTTSHQTVRDPMDDSTNQEEEPFTWQHDKFNPDLPTPRPHHDHRLKR